MDSGTATNKEPSADRVSHQYNFQHLVFVTKYRYKMFKNPKTIAAIRSALYNVAERYKISIKEMSFGDDFAHVHLETGIPNTMSVANAVVIKVIKKVKQVV